MKKITLFSFIYLFFIASLFAQEPTSYKGIKIFKQNQFRGIVSSEQIFNQEFQLNSQNQFISVKNEANLTGFTTEKFQQYYQGVKVEFGEISLHRKQGNLHSMSYNVAPLENVNVSPGLSSENAFNRAILHVGASRYLWEDSAQMALVKDYARPMGELVVFSNPNNTSFQAVIAYKFDIYAIAPLYRADVYVDAQTGQILLENNTIHIADVPATGESLYNGIVSFTADDALGNFRLQQTLSGGGVNTFDLNNGTNYAAATDITSDTNVFSVETATGVQAHWGAENTYNYFSQKHGRDSYDNQGTPLNSYVSYGFNYVNAFWDGSRMTYGDGDGVNYGPLVSLDIVGHEIAHGVTQHSANLLYQKESGALNESFSDIFGEAIEFFGSGTNDWLMGDHIGAGGSNGALRSFSNPNQFGDPDTYGGVFWINPDCSPSPGNDYCGVHTNSGVQNYWFYLLSVGGSGTNDIGNDFTVNAIGMEKAAAVAYRNLSVYLNSTSTFEEARIGAIQSAIDLYGENSQEEIEVTNAWHAVGVGNKFLTPNSIKSLVLVDANSNEDILELKDGVEINLLDLSTNLLNIRADVTSLVESVSFELVGPLNQNNVDNTEQYSLFGGSSTSEFLVGDYTLTVTPYSEDDAGGDIGNGITMNFSIISVDEVPPVLTCSGDIFVQVGENECETIVTIEQPLATDNSGNVISIIGTRNDGKELAAPFSLGNTYIEWVAVDEADNESIHCIQTINVQESISQTLVCPEDISVLASGVNGAIVSYELPNVSNSNCVDISEITTKNYIVNGRFETADLSGWILDISGSGSVIINDGSYDPPGTNLALEPISGNYDVIFAQTGPTKQLISKPFTVPTNVMEADISWKDRIRNTASVFSDPSQEFRVELLDENMNVISEIFSTNPGDPNIQIGPNPRQFELTEVLQEYAGKQVCVKFVEEDNLNHFNVNLDDISLNITGNNNAQPEHQITQTAGLSSGSLFPIGTTTNTFEVQNAQGVSTCSFDVVVNQDVDSDSDGVLNQFDQCPNTPLGEDVDEHGCEFLKVIYEHNVESASKWFGGDDRPNFGPRNVGTGQSIFFESDAVVETFSTKFSGRFDFSGSPENIGHEVELVLQLRDAEGLIISSTNNVLSSNFDGGWVRFVFDNPIPLEGNNTYNFTWYLKDGLTNNYDTGSSADGSSSFELGNGLSSEVFEGGSDLDFDDFQTWWGHGWDFLFKITGEKNVNTDPDFALRINTGGTEATYNDNIYVSDAYFNTGNTLDRPQTGLPEPYQSFRFSRSQEMSYNIPIPDGEYTVNLYFAELWFGATGGGSGGVGSRVFDVNIEGILAEDNLDVFAEVGADAMLMKTHVVTVTGGELNIDFSSLAADGGVRHPIINAIEILGATTKPQSKPFITTWETYNSGNPYDQITISTHPDEIYNYTVDWGDGKSNSGVSGNITHTYKHLGTYQVSIYGQFPRIYFEGSSEKNKIIAVNQWGNQEWSSMQSAFAGCSNLDVLATDVPNLENVNSMSYMFSDCSSLVGNDSINQWDVSTITNMELMFSGASSFNQPIGDWNVENVINMRSMFSGASIFNQPIGAWNVGKVTDMSGMFAHTTSFNQNLENWNVENVELTTFMFTDAKQFNQPLNSWNIKSLKDMSYMFALAKAFNQDVRSWDVSGVISMEFMFEGASAFNWNLGEWNVSNARYMSGLFNSSGLSVENYDNILKGWGEQQLQSEVVFGAQNIQYCQGEEARQKIIDDFGWTITDGGKAIDCPDENSFLTTWKTDNLGISNDNQITIPTFPGEVYDYVVNWGDGTSDSGVTGDIVHTYAIAGTYKVSISGDFPRIYFNNPSGIDSFSDASKLMLVEQWGDLTWSSMNSAFNGCKNLDVTALDSPNLKEVSDLSYMFGRCASLIGNSAFGDWDISGITNMSNLFAGASSFNNEGVITWNTSNVTNMSNTFNGGGVFNQNIGSWDTSKVERMEAMFLNASLFNQDIGGWDVSQVTDMYLMFEETANFNQDISNWDVSKVKNMGYMFHNSSLSQENYDALLLGWSSLPTLQNGVIFDASSKYCSGESGRQKLIDDFGWVITDAGKASDCEEPNDFALRINAGGVSTTYNGETFVDDIYFNTGNTLDRPQTGLPEPYQSFRFSRSQQMSYDVPVPDGEYTINLYFAELWFGATGGGSGGVGSRVFDVNIENILAEDNLDVFAEVGADAMLMKAYTVTVTDGMLNIDFDSRAEVGGERHPIVNAIEILGKQQETQRSFITTWKTDNPGISNDNQITIPTFPGEVYDYVVNWGDGTSDSGVTGDITHTYDTPGTYKVSISGGFPRIYFNGSAHGLMVGDEQKILMVNQWGDAKWSSMEFAFKQCINIDINSLDTPNLSLTKSTGSMFYGCIKLEGNSSFESWDMSSVIDMSKMFEKAELFNQDIGNWDVSNVKNLNAMFLYAISFNQDIGSWDVSNVESMSSLFYSANSFNQNISKWDVSNTIWMQSLFNYASSFNQDISNWDTSSAESMHFMFYGATSFNQDISNWDISNVSNMEGMFSQVTLSNFNYNTLLNGWSTQNVRNGVKFDGGNSQYCLGESGRQKLIDDYGWIIMDGGKAADCEEPNDFVLRINTGGTEIDYNGETFVTDTYFNTGNTLDRPQTGLPEPYQSFRYSPSQQMSYNIPVPDGEYTVNLYFAELWFGATGGGSGGVGSRVFDVNIEGVLAEDNLDIFAEVGADAMLMKAHTVTVTGGVLNIDFDSSNAVEGERHPVINAIEVLSINNQTNNNQFFAAKGVGADIIGLNNVEMQLFPNPAQEHTTVSFSRAITIDAITIFDIHGRLIQTISGNNVSKANGNVVNVDTFSPGMYIIRAKDTAGNTYQKQLVVR